MRTTGARSKLPEKLLLEQSRGNVLFITGAGTSIPSRLPDFKKLVVETYRHLNPAVFKVLARLAEFPEEKTPPGLQELDNKQLAEVERFRIGEYDVVLGMLERRLDGPSALKSSVRLKIAELLRTVTDDGGKPSVPKPSSIHKSLVRLADRGGTTTIATTNFDLLLERAATSLRYTLASHSLGGIPRPGRSAAFSGVMHIHGSIGSRAGGSNELVVTDQDFGEYYLRRRVVPDFIYDVARLYHIVLVGYRANDAPMRYLLNAVAADGNRFDDLKDRYAFVGMHSPGNLVEIEDWKGRGIIPIPYNSDSNHAQLSNTFEVWSKLLSLGAESTYVDGIVKRVVSKPRGKSNEAEADLVDHLFRRGTSSERSRLAKLLSNARADSSWMDAMANIVRESPGPNR